jgi:hypothetical protein
MAKRCAHGKSLDEECLACAAMDRIERRKEEEAARLRDVLKRTVTVLEEIVSCINGTVRH